MLLIPSQAFPGAATVELLGIVLTTFVVGKELLAKRKWQAA
jgi:hypothetical protein